MRSGLFKLKVRVAHLLSRTHLPDSIIAHSGWKIILAFHRIVPLFKVSKLGLHSSLYITPEKFEDLLSSLKSIGKFVDISTLLFTNSSDTLFSVTFDDGWVDTYTTAYPILKKLGIPFSIFVSTALIEDGVMNWTEDVVGQYSKVCAERPVLARKAVELLRANTGNNKFGNIYPIVESLKYVSEDLREARLKAFYKELGVEPIRGEMLSWEQLEELAGEGVLIGSHTHSHTILKGAPETKITEELYLSKKFIKDKLNINANMFCYPNGLYEKSHEVKLREAGYQIGLITDDKRVRRNYSPYFLPRFLVYEDIIPLLYYRFIKER